MRMRKLLDEQIQNVHKNKNFEILNEKRIAAE
jgi:hypothetical protein